MHRSMAMAATSLPRDVEKAFLQFLREEKNELAKLSLETVLQNCKLGQKEGRQFVRIRGIAVLCEDR